MEHSNLENNIKNVMQRNFGSFGPYDEEKEQLDELLEEELEKKFSVFSAGC